MHHHDDRHKVLFVDDEAQARKYFEKAYRNDLDVLTAASAREADQALTHQGDEIGVIVSDQRMPGESGVEFLARVRQRRPQIVRILTTAYSDIDSAIDAVNTGAVFRYVSKPWDIHELRGILIRAMDVHRLQRERDTLVQEKLGVLEHMLLMDRSRLFMVLAAALRGRINNAPHAICAFLDWLGDEPIRRIDAHAQETDLWATAFDRTRGVLQRVEELLTRLQPTRPAPLACTALIESAAGSVPLHVNADDEVLHSLAPLHVDAHLAGEALTALVNALAALHNAPQIHVQAQPVQVHDVAGVRLCFTAASPRAQPQPGSDPADVEVNLLLAWLVALHHGGDLAINPNQATLELPLDPRQVKLPPLPCDWIERALTSFEPVI